MQPLGPVPLQVVCCGCSVERICQVCKGHCNNLYKNVAGSNVEGAPSARSDKDFSDDIVIGPMPHARTPPSGDKQTRAAQVQAAFLCGVINAIITIPVMTSFAAIIFQASTNHHLMTMSPSGNMSASCCFCQQQQTACCPVKSTGAYSAHLAVLTKHYALQRLLMHKATA